MDLDLFVPAIQARDTRAFAQWMARAEAPLRESLRSFVAVVDVESVLQESLLRVWHVAPRFVPDGRPNGLFRLGIRIARNLALSEVRRTRARAVPEADLERALAEGQAALETLPDPFLRAALADCHGQLPHQPRRVIDARLSAEGGTSDDVIASTLGMRLNTFLQNFGRARKLLAECLRKARIDLGEELGT